MGSPLVVELAEIRVADVENTALTTYKDPPQGRVNPPENVETPQKNWNPPEFSLIFNIPNCIYHFSGITTTLKHKAIRYNYAVIMWMIWTSGVSWSQIF